jgi:MarR family transcriptional regulator, organic hydroperoxide resistance regulator
MSIMISRNQLIDDAMQAQKQIVQAMHAAAEPTWLQLDLTMAQLKGLFALADSPMTIGQLAEALGSGKPAASILVERLVQLGLVERAEDPLDRRRTIARVTAQGEELVARLRQGGRDRLRAWLSRLGDDDLAALVQGLQALATVASGEQVALPA